MIVIGADTHKGSHALAAVDEGTLHEHCLGLVDAEMLGYGMHVQEP